MAKSLLYKFKPIPKPNMRKKTRYNPATKTIVSPMDGSKGKNA